MPQFEQFEVFSSLIFWSLLSFGIFFFLLKKFVFPPILETLDEREKKIRGDIESADKLKKEAVSIKEDLEKELKSAHDKAKTIVQMANSESKKIQEKSLEETQAPPMELGVKSGNSSMLPLSKPSYFAHNIFWLQRHKRYCLLHRLADELTIIEPEVL